MKVTTNAKKIAKQMTQISKVLRKSGIKTQREAADRVVINAIRLAPKHTGATIRGIRSRKTKNGYIAESTVPGKFKQNIFANQRAPYRTLNFGVRGGSYYYGPTQTVIYGGSAFNRDGEPILWTGTPRFFDRAVQLVQKKYPRILARNTKTALKTIFR